MASNVYPHRLTRMAMVFDLRLARVFHVYPHWLARVFLVYPHKLLIVCPHRLARVVSIYTEWSVYSLCSYNGVLRVYMVVTFVEFSRLNLLFSFAK